MAQNHYNLGISLYQINQVHTQPLSLFKGLGYYHQRNAEACKPIERTRTMAANPSTEQKATAQKTKKYPPMI